MTKRFFVHGSKCASPKFLNGDRCDLTYKNISTFSALLRLMRSLLVGLRPPLRGMRSGPRRPPSRVTWTRLISTCRHANTLTRLHSSAPVGSPKHWLVCTCGHSNTLTRQHLWASQYTDSSAPVGTPIHWLVSTCGHATDSSAPACQDTNSSAAACTPGHWLVCTCLHARTLTRLQLPAR